jgi:hypothetical protein
MNYTPFGIMKDLLMSAKSHHFSSAVKFYFITGSILIFQFRHLNPERYLILLFGLSAYSTYYNIIYPAYFSYRTNVLEGSFGAVLTFSFLATVVE